MNERIQELWDKAEHSVNEVFVWDPTGPDREDVIREKFAELIVRECASQAAHWTPADGQGAEDQEKFILKHFGIEE